VSRPFDSETARVASRLGVEARARLREERALVEAGLADDPRKILDRIDQLQQEIVRLATKLARMKSRPAVPSSPVPVLPSTTDRRTPTNGHAAPVEPPHYDPAETEHRLADMLAKSHGTNGHGAAAAAAPAPRLTIVAQLEDGRYQAQTPEGETVFLSPEEARKLSEARGG
jgi:hypothetical protein